MMLGRALGKALKPTAVEIKERSLLVGLGAMKSGTSWLSDYLRRHPDFFHSPINEMNIFNRFWPNPYQHVGDEVRLLRMEDIILDSRIPRRRKHRERLKALAQLGRIKSFDNYLEYFADRMNSESHFGEISPAYSHIPANALREISGITSDVRYVFLMRDPTARTASHIEHARRRSRAGDPIDKVIDEVVPGRTFWRRSNYAVTLDAIEEAGIAGRTKLIFYERLFREDTIRDLCDWLGLSYVTPDFDKRLNPSRGKKVDSQQRRILRERLDPIYRSLETRFGESRPKEWLW